GGLRDPLRDARRAYRWHIRLSLDDDRWTDPHLVMISWVLGDVRYRTGRFVALTLTVALATAFTATLAGFLIFVRTQVETRAANDVDVDWQVELARDAAPSDVLKVVGRTPGVTRHELVGYGDVTQFEATTGGTTQTTGSGKIIGLGPHYRSSFPAEIRTLIGATSGVLLAQQTAANLRAGPGDHIRAVLASGRR